MVDKGALALISVIIGAGIGAGATLVVTLIQRRWQREDTQEQRQEKARALTTTRGEQLLAQCQQLVEWKETARKVAFTGEGQGFVPPQGPMYRIAAIVELFFPELEELSRSLDNAAVDYRHQLRGIAQLLQAGSAVSAQNKRVLHEDQDRLERALGMFIEAARKLIREKIR